MKNATIIRVCPIKRLYSLVESFNNRAEIAAVLCSTTPVSKAKLDGIQHIYVSFADITDAKRFDAFQIEKAQRIKKFVDNLKGIRVLYVCCDSGESRSTAVAAAILRYWKRDEMKIWKNTHFHPNPLVYHLQSKAFGCPSTKLRALLLSQYNKRLFRKKIQSQR